MTRFRTEIDALTGNVTIRPYTDEENAQAEIDETSKLDGENDTPESTEVTNGD